MLLDKVQKDICVKFCERENAKSKRKKNIERTKQRKGLNGKVGKRKSAKESCSG